MTRMTGDAIFIVMPVLFVATLFLGIIICISEGVMDVGESVKCVCECCGVME